MNLVTVRIQLDGNLSQEGLNIVVSQLVIIKITTCLFSNDVD